MKRREFLKTTAALATAAPLLQPRKILADVADIEVNDVHSQLNPTTVRAIATPKNVDELQAIVKKAHDSGHLLSICGARHAMGGQQFGRITTLIDTTKMNKIHSVDKTAKTVTLDAGVMWPQLMEYLQKNAPELCIIQKQTGADELTLGGALASNIHGRSLTKKPLISDVISFTLVKPDGNIITCSRDENHDLFKKVIGGYGLFGAVGTITLRLGNRIKLRRVVEITTTDKLMEAVSDRVKNGYLYGDFQYMTDEKHDDFMRRGIFSCYVPVADDTPLSEASHDLGLKAWQDLYRLAHLDKQKAYQVYRDHYLATNGQVYWSDAHQTGIYLKEFNKQFAKERGEKAGSSLMLSEVYVPRDKFFESMEKFRAEALKRGMDIIYGTVRFIERDDESFLPWAKQDYACIIFNLYIVHSDAGIEKAKQDFQALYDIALAAGGSYYLTYHRWARKDQVLKAYPLLPELLAEKRRIDSREIFQSDWYRHYKTMFT
ncbi:MAG TPA: FAD-binding oxidoreductase [Patescibacteria group bacterium]|nr:FAD-binding oxidoreductase [Patescibacteria group bacterium]